MPLIQCPECQREVSSEALSCPQCAFPHPGKKERLNGRASETLLTCQDCGNPISKHAHACPHCGAPLNSQSSKDGAGDSVTEISESVDQTWLCPNCGVPYTRRIKGTKTELLETGSSVTKIPAMNSRRMHTQQKEDRVGLDGRSSSEMLISRKERKRNPLWEEAKVYVEEPQFPRPRRKWGLFFLVVFAILSIIFVSFAFWRLKGLNPLEALVYWQM